MSQEGDKKVSIPQQGGEMYNQPASKKKTSAKVEGAWTTLWLTRKKAVVDYGRRVKRLASVREPYLLESLSKWEILLIAKLENTALNDDVQPETWDHSVVQEIFTDSTVELSKATETKLKVNTEYIFYRTNKV